MKSCPGFFFLFFSLLSRDGRDCMDDRQEEIETHRPGMCEARGTRGGEREREGERGGVREGESCMCRGKKVPHF